VSSFFDFDCDIVFLYRKLFFGAALDWVALYPKLLHFPVPLLCTPICCFTPVTVARRPFLSSEIGFDRRMAVAAAIVLPSLVEIFRFNLSPCCWELQYCFRSELWGFYVIGSFYSSFASVLSISAKFLVVGKTMRLIWLLWWV